MSNLGREALLAWRPAAWALVLTVASGLPAVAQNNSLFGRGARSGNGAGGVPTSQPATGTPVTPVSGRTHSARSALAENLPSPQANEVLLHTSPYAVRLPKPEQLKVNDLVTIVVRISKSAKSDSKLQSKKDWKHEWSLDQWIKLSDKHGIVPALLSQGTPAAKFDLKNDYKGDGKYDRSDSFTTRIQATVVDIKPNGNLTLEAVNDVKMSDEEYTVTLTGTCRSRDVTPENTVLSSQIANLTVHVDDRGAVRDASRRGWAQRLFDFLRPF